MPELPDVETVARRLRRTVAGRRITGVRVLSPATIHSPHPRRFIGELSGRTVRTVDRRGKYLLFRLSAARDAQIPAAASGSDRRQRQHLRGRAPLAGSRAPGQTGPPDATGRGRPAVPEHSPRPAPRGHSPVALRPPRGPVSRSAGGA